MYRYSTYSTYAEHTIFFVPSHSMAILHSFSNQLALRQNTNVICAISLFASALALFMFVQYCDAYAVCTPHYYYPYTTAVLLQQVRYA